MPVIPLVPMDPGDILDNVDGQAHVHSEFADPKVKEFYERMTAHIKNGDIFSYFNDMVNSGSQASQDSWWMQLINGLSGKYNTDATNAATAALQEDAQAFNALEAQKQRDFTSLEAQIAREWQERMSNTAVQRQAADLKAAGFNPWLATNGSGASTGSVGIASGDSASSAQGQGINATKSGAEMLAMAGITAASIIKIVKMLK